jgi:hypothetical protein
VSRLLTGQVENYNSIPETSKKFIFFFIKNILLWEVLTEEENFNLTHLFVPALQTQPQFVEHLGYTFCGTN